MAIRREQITFTNTAGVGDTITINAGSKQHRMSASANTIGVVGTYDANLATATLTANSFAQNLVADNATYNMLGPIDVDYSEFSNVVTITFLDSSVTTSSITEIGSLTLTLASTTEAESVYNYDSIINVRSPHFYTVDEQTGISGFSGAEIHIYAYSGNRYTDRPTEPTYVIRSVAAEDSNNSISFNVSEFAKSYFDNYYPESGFKVSWNPYIDIFPYAIHNGIPYSKTPEFGIAYYGYGYFEDGINPQHNEGVLIDNKVIVTKDDFGFSIPIDGDLIDNVSFTKNGEIVSKFDTYTFENSVAVIQYASNGVDSFHSYKDASDGNYMEWLDNALVREFEMQHSVIPVDQAFIESKDGVVTVIDVKLIDECKYTPVKVTFTNKYGALQSVWFFKNSVKTLKVKEDSYRRNTKNQFGTYNITDHQYKNLYKSGKESIKLNSGFYPEEYNEVFKQMMLSEDIWLFYDDKELPANITDSSFQFKTGLNDNLIEYSIKCDFAYDTINTIN